MGLSWTNVVACTTDGAPSILGHRSGFRAKIQEVQPSIQHLHCMIHRYALASKTLPSDLKSVLDDAIRIVNRIKSSALNSRILRLLCEEFENAHEVLLSVSWQHVGEIAINERGSHRIFQSNSCLKMTFFVEAR